MVKITTNLKSDVGKVPRPAIISAHHHRRCSRVTIARTAKCERLSRNIKKWKAITNDPEILQIVEWGLKFQFKTTPSQRQTKGVEFRGSPEMMKNLAEQIRSWLDEKSIEPIALGQAKIISLLFPVVQPNKTRWVLDLKHLNKHLVEHKFKLDGINTVRNYLQRGDYCVTLDLSAAYFHCKMNRKHRRYLAFRALGKIFQFNAMVFGISSAPFVFTQLTKPIIAQLHQQGIRCSIYLDDLIIAAHSRSEALRHLEIAAHLFQQLGFEINWEKSQTVPTRRLIYLGMTIDTAPNRFTISAPPKKLAALRKEARQVETKHFQGTLTVRHLARLTGKLTALMIAVPAARFRRHSLSRSVNYGLRASYDSESGKGYFDNYDVPVSLSRTALRDCRWLQRCSPRITKTHTPIRPPKADATLTTDASPTGFGAILQIGGRRLKLAQFWNPKEQQMSQNMRELTGLVRAFQHFWKNEISKVKVLLIRTDNTTALSCLRRFGSRHKHLGEVVDPLLRAILSHRIVLRAHHVPGILNGAADRLSRLAPDNNEWEISHAAVHRACRQFQIQPTMDWFATKTTTKCNRFASRHWCDKATLINAFAHHWDAETGYWAPPINLISQVLAKILDDGAHGILVVPHWPTAPWFPTVVQKARGTHYLHKAAFIPPKIGHPMRDGQAPPLTAFLL